MGYERLTPQAKKAVELSMREALQLGHNYIGTEHLLLGLLREGQGGAALLLSDLGIELPWLRKEVAERLGKRNEIDKQIADLKRIIARAEALIDLLSKGKAA